ncbi:topoisomerase [Tamilnaduibacter salinus]|uniref:Topoisomerase n=1 Tax=Tamilnaduibacter salinus TaxID=1484056 RepID=A0A2A2I7H9_9GAMM|nr:toprim domain-containing protein [Tamilnaduibacter salinus]PAV27532.1 topoisomerase [Tamilnaduibacter salinus]
MKKAPATEAAKRPHQRQSITAGGADPMTHLFDTMAAGGIVPANPSDVRARLADGALIRFATQSKPAKRNGWLVAYFDRGAPVTAVAGDWAEGSDIRWNAENPDNLTPSERREQRQRMERARALREAEQARIHAEAAEKALRIWQSASPATHHDYLIRKAVRPHRARLSRGSLVLDVRDFDRQLHTLQFIRPDGSKQLLSGGAKRGHFIPVAGPSDPARVLVCEGWATGCTLADDDPDALVLAAIDAGNLTPVTSGARNRWPHADLIVCADDDRTTPGNPGATAARAAALAAGCRVAFPKWPANAPLELSDFNDLANWQKGAA